MRKRRDQGLTQLDLQRKTRNKQKEPQRISYSKRKEPLIEKETEDARKDYENLEGVFAASPDILMVTDLNGKIIECNQATLETYGVSSKNELIGKNALNFIAEKDRKRARDDLRKALKQFPVKSIEYTLLKRNGTEYPAEISASIVKDPSGKPKAFVGIIKDITKRKEAEKTIRESQHKFERLFRRIPEAAIYADSEWRILDVNSRFTELFGYTLDEIKGKKTHKTIVPKDKIEESIMLGKRSKKGHTYYDTVRKRKDGSLVPVSLSVSPLTVDGQPVGYVGLYKDITERKQAEEALSQSEKRYRSVVDNVGVGVAVIGPKMEILSLNKQMKKWFPQIDTSKRPICYKTFNNPPRKKVCNYCPTIKTLKNGRTHEAITDTPSGGKVINYRVVSSPIKDKNGKITAAIEMVEDVTERKQMEERLKRYSEHLEESVEERTRKLQESEENFRSVADYASEAVITMDSHGTITFWNKAAEAIFGYSAKEAIGKPIMFIMPKRLNKNHLKIAHQLSPARKSSSVGKTSEFTVRRKDGSTLPIEHSFSMWKTKQGTFFTCIVRDITERKRMEGRLSALNFYGRKLNAAHSFQQVHELTLEAVAKILGFEYATFEVLEKDKIRVTCHRGYSKPALSELPLDGTKKGIIVKAVNTRRPIIVSDVTKDKDYVQVVPDIKSELAVPVISENKILGVINVESKTIGAFNEKDAVLLQILASHAATAMGNITKRSEIEKRSNQLASLMKSAAEMIRSSDVHQSLQAIVEAIREFGWRRVVLSVRDENLEIALPEDIVTAGLTKEERTFLWTNKQPGQVWRERFGPEFQRFRIGEFYHLPWSDPWVRKRFSEGTVESHLTQEEMVDWNPDDLLYAPLRLTDGRIVGVVSMDDPIDGKRPTKKSLAPLELFLHQAAVTLEKAQLIKQLKVAKVQLQEYADQLELKVKQRTQELMQKTEDLIKSEEKLQSIFAASPDAITVTDLEGRVIECNQAALTINGCSSREEIIGRSAFEFITKRDHQRAMINLKKTLEDGSATNIEYTCITQDGQEFPAELSASVIRDASGNPTAFVGILKDITERKQMEQRLIISERLAAIGELAAMVGHDLRNPLTGIAGATYYLEKKLSPKLDKKANMMLKMIANSIEYSNKIINDLLDYSRELQLERTETNPQAIVKEMLEQTNVPTNIQISNTTRGKLRVLVDSEKIKRVFLNIIKNAIDAMPKGGKLTIKSIVTKNDWQIVFADSGVGMPNDVLEKLWTPFFTTKAKGMGLGLSICKRIIEAHGGTISVESKVGEGTTFTVTVPIRPKTEEGGEEIWIKTPESLLLTTTKT